MLSSEGAGSRQGQRLARSHLAWIGKRNPAASDETAANHGKSSIGSPKLLIVRFLLAFCPLQPEQAGAAAEMARRTLPRGRAR
ncbi:MAG: hypothetical protein DWQ37_07930 [Planctomycetota bacterium]|nr:MAG: hypothetical protein DWQ37_07930 [Planctomycetota bacterium]